MTGEEDPTLPPTRLAGARDAPKDPNLDFRMRLQLLIQFMCFFKRDKHSVGTESPLWRSPTWSGKGEHETASVKMHMKWKVAVNAYYRIVHFYYFKCFRLLFKSEGNARLFSNLVWRTDGRGAGGRRGQTCQTKIYYRIEYFYCFKCFRLVLKSKGNAYLFANFVWQRKCSQFLKLCLADDNGQTFWW